MNVWEKIGALHCEFAAVFEDDAVCIPSRTTAGRTFLKMLHLHEGGILWLNDYERFVGSKTKITLDRIKSRVEDRLRKSPRLVPWDGKTEITTEAYLIKPKLAQDILSSYQYSIGAIDEIMRDFIFRQNCKSYRMRPPLFKQNDRSDSDIR
jgi:GR25 family glycosyltransferase involved in LPS biosynthesis